MVHVQTGNALDVVYDYEGDKMVLKGLQQHDDPTLIPLRDPQALISVLTRILKEVETRNGKETSNG